MVRCNFQTHSPCKITALPIQQFSPSTAPLRIRGRQMQVLILIFARNSLPLQYQHTALNTAQFHCSEIQPLLCLGFIGYIAYSTIQLLPFPPPPFHSSNYLKGGLKKNEVAQIWGWCWIIWQIFWFSMPVTPTPRLKLIDNFYRRPPSLLPYCPRGRT